MQDGVLSFRASTLKASGSLMDTAFAGQYLGRFATQQGKRIEMRVMLYARKRQVILLRR